MAQLEASTIVNVPIEQVYALWCQFERYPEFMAHVREVRRLGERRLAWRGRVGDTEREWETIISDQIPNQRIAWRSVGEPHIHEAIELFNVNGTTRVTMSRNHARHSLSELIVGVLGIEENMLHANLQRFKRHAELLAAVGALNDATGGGSGERAAGGGDDRRGHLRR